MENISTEVVSIDTPSSSNSKRISPRDGLEGNRWGSKNQWALALAALTPTLMHFGDDSSNFQEQLWSLTALQAIPLSVIVGLSWGNFIAVIISILFLIGKYVIFLTCLRRLKNQVVRRASVGSIILLLFLAFGYSRGVNVSLSMIGVTLETQKHSVFARLKYWFVPYQQEPQTPIAINELEQACLTDCVHAPYSSGYPADMCFQGEKMIYFYKGGTRTAGYRSGVLSSKEDPEFFSNLPNCEKNYTYDCKEPIHAGFCKTGLSAGYSASEKNEAEYFYVTNGIPSDPQERLRLATGEAENRFISNFPTIQIENRILFIRDDGKITNGDVSFGYLIKDEVGQFELIPNYHFSKTVHYSEYGTLVKEYVAQFTSYANKAGRSFFDVYGFDPTFYEEQLIKAIPFLSPERDSFPVCKNIDQRAYRILGGYRYDDAPKKPREMSISDSSGNGGIGTGKITPEKKVVWSDDDRMISGRALLEQELRECQNAHGENFFDIYDRYLQLISTGIKPTKTPSPSLVQGLIVQTQY